MQEEKRKNLRSKIKNEEIKPVFVRNDMRLYRHRKSGNAVIIANIPPTETRAFINTLKEFCNNNEFKHKLQNTIKEEKDVTYTAFNYRDQKSIVIVDNVDPAKDDVLYVFGYNN